MRSAANHARKVRKHVPDARKGDGRLPGCDRRGVIHVGPNRAGDPASRRVLRLEAEYGVANPKVIKYFGSAHRNLAALVTDINRDSGLGLPAARPLPDDWPGGREALVAVACELSSARRNSWGHRQDALPKPRMRGPADLESGIRRLARRAASQVMVAGSGWVLTARCRRV
jgi:hypothetical protein